MRPGKESEGEEMKKRRRRKAMTSELTTKKVKIQEAQ
jgi:hypothetical protein